MTNDQIEKKVSDLVYRDPFVPFVVEMIDGESLVVPHPRLAFDDTGAGFIGSDGGLVDFEFRDVRTIRINTPEAVA